MGVQFAGNILVQTNGGPLPISAGGTGQTTAPTAINALLPAQTGQSGKILTTNGTNVSWTSGAVTPGGADTNIQFNDAGTFSGNAFFTVNKSTGALTSTSTFKSIGLVVSDSDALYRTLKYQTSGSNRWLAQADNTTEAGSNSGSDFEFVRVADNGATTNQVYTVSRATGVFDFKATPTVNGGAISDVTSFNTRTGAITLISTDVTDALGFTPGEGSVTSASVVSANGFAGSVATSTTTPAITISTSVSGLLKGNGTAISAATSGTDYSVGTSALATGIVKSTTSTGVLSIAVAGDFPTLNQSTTGNAATVTNGVYTTDIGTVTNTMLAGSIANAKLTNSSVTVGSTNVALGATATTLAGLTSVTSTTFVGALTGNATTATTATNIAAGVAGNVHYQSGVGATAFVTNAAGVLQAATSGATPAWTTTPTLTGTNFTGIPNAGLTNSSITFGATSQALGSTVSALNAVSIGATTASSGAFTTLTSSGATTISGAFVTTSTARMPNLSIGADTDIYLYESATNALTIRAGGVGTEKYTTFAANGTLVVASGGITTVAPSSFTANSASAALTVTQTGSGNAFVVEDSASPDSTPFVITGTGAVNSSGFYTQLIDYAELRLRPFSGANLNGWRLVSGINGASDGEVTLQHSTDNFSANFTNALVAGATGYCKITDNSANAALTVTQTGAGNAFVVEDVASDTTPFVIDSVGNVGVGASSDATVKLYTVSTASAASTGEYAGYFQLSAANTTGASTKIALAGLAVSATGSTTNTLIGVQGDAYQNAAIATTQLVGVSGRAYTLAAGTISQMYGVSALIANAGAATVTSTYGYYMPDHTVGTNNYGFYSNLAAGTNKYNFYAAGTADNYLAGSLGIGGVPATGYKLLTYGSWTGSTTFYGTSSQGTIQSDVTTAGVGFRGSVSTAAAAFTVSNVMHFLAEQGTIGAASAITNQYGFNASAGLIGATNNYGLFAGNTAAVTAGKTAYGFYSSVNTATGGGTTWGFYGAGTARNYMAGNLNLGSSTNAGTLHIKNTGTVTFDSTSAFTSSTAGLQIMKYSDTNAYIDNYDGDLIFRGAAFAERARITAAGQVKVTNTVVVNNIGTLGTQTLTTSTTAVDQIIDSVPIATYRVATYKISITSGSAYQYTEVVMIHDGTNVYITENCTVRTGANLATFNADISAGNMRLLTTPVNAVTVIKSIVTAIVV